MLSNGVHDEGGEYVHIHHPVSIVGESRDGCTVIGGLRILAEDREDREDNVYVKDLTLFKSNNDGVHTLWIKSTLHCLYSFG